MAKIRITRELLDHLLDLPESNQITPNEAVAVDVDGVICFVFDVTGDSQLLPYGTTTYALQYEETEVGTSLVSALPVPD